jgi:hypothetical protein
MARRRPAESRAVLSYDGVGFRSHRMKIDVKVDTNGSVCVLFVCLAAICIAAMCTGHC